jgi:hypothetical protein
MRTSWWAPRHADWQVAALFAVGSTCFALGALPLYADWVGVKADDWTYFVGSIFFTTAALLQLLISAGAVHADARPSAGVQWRRLVRSPRSAEWWAGVVQFGGTLLFNVSTFEALRTLSEVEEKRRVWSPDFLGSIAFLVASGLAFADVRRPWLQWRPRDLGWSVAMLNMGRLDRLRDLGRRQQGGLRRRGAQPRARQPRHLRGCARLPGRGHPAHPRPGRGRGERTRLTPQAAWARRTARRSVIVRRNGDASGFAA